MNRVRLLLENKIVGRLSGASIQVSSSDANRSRLVKLSVAASFLVLAVILASPQSAQAVVKTSQGDGNWTAITWSPAGAPAAGDDVIIRNGDDVVLNTTTTVASLQVGQGTSGTLTMGDSNTDRTLTVTGSITVSAGATFTSAGDGGNLLNIGGNLTNNGTFSSNGGDLTTVTFNGAAPQTIGGSSTLTFNDLTLSGTATVTTAANLTLGDDLTVGTGTTFTVAGNDITVAGTTSVTGTLIHNNTTGTKTYNGLVIINAGGVWNNSGNEGITFNGGLTHNGTTFTAGTGIQLFDADETIGGSSAISIPSLTVNSGGDDVTNAGNLAITTALAGAGEIINSATGTLTINFGGAIGLTTLTANAGGNVVNYSFAGAQTVKVPSAGYDTLNLSGSGTKTLAAGLTVNTSVTIASGVTLDMLAFTLSLSSATITVNGTLDFTDANGSVTSTAATSVLTVGANGLIRTIDANGVGPAATASLIATAAFTTTSIDTNGTVEYYRSSDSTGIISDRNYNNLIITNVGTKTWTIAATRTVNGNLTINASAPLTLSGAQIINVKGNWSNSGTFTAGTSTIAFNGTLAQTIGGTVATTFSGLTINNVAGVTLDTSTDVGAIVSLVLTLTTDLTVTTPDRLTQQGTSAGAGDVVGTVRRTDVTTVARSFGNLNNVITNGVAGPIVVDVALVKGVAPGGFASAVLRSYSITGSPTAATLRLHYLDSELNGNAEGLLHLWRAVGSPTATWTDQGVPAATDTGAGNWVQNTGVGAFSVWTFASAPQAPTDITMVGYGARAGRDGKTLIQWETGREVNNLGFNIYREENDQRVRINKSLIVGSGLMASPGTVMTAGRSYLWQTSPDQPKDAAFWVEEIDLSGYTVWHGPIVSKHSDAKLSPREQAIADQTLTLSDMASESAFNGVTRPVEALANTAKASAMKLTGAIVTPKPPVNPFNPAVKISLKHEGWYRVTQPQLVAAGLNPSVDPTALQLFADNKEIPISVITNNGAFDETSAIEFYGQPIDTPSTDTHVYSLVAGSNGLRITNAQSPGGLPPSASFLYTVERKDRSIYLTGVHNGDAENFFGTPVGAASVDQAITLKNVDPTAAGQATLELAMQGFTNGSHVVTVSLNGNSLGTVQYSNQQQGVSQFQVPNSMLSEGQNIVTLASQPGGADVSLVAHIRASYWHSYAADTNSLKFSADANQEVTLTGFTSGDVKVFDVTNPFSISQVPVSVTSQKTSPAVAVTVAVPGTGTRTLLALGGDQIRSALSVRLDKPSSWRSPANAADLVIITHDSLADSYIPLQTLRRSQGLKVALVDVEDLYDEFNFGNKSPQAIKDFLAYAKTSWKTAPKYVLLAGSASYDPKNYNGWGDYDLVPTKLIDTVITETASDDFFADFNNDGIAEMAVGRLPTFTSDEAQTTVAKLLTYENTTSNNSALLVADGNLDFDFEAANDSIAALFPGSITVQQIDRGQIGTAAARQQLFDGIAAGQKFVNYVGHGSPSIWRDNLLNAADALGMTNIGRYPLFIAMTCLNGEFQHPQLNPLASALMNSREGGAIAVWASSGMTGPSSQTVMNQAFYTQVFQTSGPANSKSPQTSQTLGEITNSAKAAVSDPDIRRTWILFGDPSMRLR